jgi:phosphoribosyl-AMP cyclohydrolase
MIEFASPSTDKAILEDSGALTPKFDDHGLVTAIVTDHRDGELLMVAHMNAEALALTIETGLAHYYSRSRKALWKKGESSGNMQSVKEIRVDCDQDAIWLKVEVAGHDATCHTGRRSCFYRRVELDNGQAKTVIIDDHRHFDPDKIYGKS